MPLICSIQNPLTHANFPLAQLKMQSHCCMVNKSHQVHDLWNKFLVFIHFQCKHNGNSYYQLSWVDTCNFSPYKQIMFELTFLMVTKKLVEHVQNNNFLVHILTLNLFTYICKSIRYSHTTVVHIVPYMQVVPPSWQTDLVCQQLNWRTFCSFQNFNQITSSKSIQSWITHKITKKAICSGLFCIMAQAGSHYIHVFPVHGWNMICFPCWMHIA